MIADVFSTIFLILGAWCGGMVFYYRNDRSVRLEDEGVFLTAGIYFLAFSIAIQAVFS